MNIEIERKFLVLSDQYKLLSTRKSYIVQGYLILDGPAIVRVRIHDSKSSIINIKENTRSISRSEYEYEIPITDAKELIKLCGDSLVEKTRWYCNINGLVWEVDQFHGKNSGLIIAEIELLNEEQTFTKPDWVGKEVSYDSRYYNTYLAKNIVVE